MLCFARRNPSISQCDWLSSGKGDPSKGAVQSLSHSRIFASREGILNKGDNCFGIGIMHFSVVNEHKLHVYKLTFEKKVSWRHPERLTLLGKLIQLLSSLRKTGKRALCPATWVSLLFSPFCFLTEYLPRNYIDNAFKELLV